MSSFSLKTGMSPPQPPAELNPVQLVSGQERGGGFGLVWKHLEILPENFQDSWLADVQLNWQSPHRKSLQWHPYSEDVLWSSDWLFWSSTTAQLGQSSFIEPSDGSTEKADKLGTRRGYFVRLKSLANSLRTFVRDWCWPQSMTILASCLLVNGDLWAIWN